MRTRVTVVTAAWPVAILVLPERIDEPAVRELIRLMDELYARGTRYALITDTRPLATIPGALERKLLTDWLTRPEQIENQRRWNVGASTIVGNALMRGALQAIYWVWTPPNPQHAARDLDDSFAYCVGMLEKAGVPLPSSAAELRRAADEGLRAG